VSVQDYPVWWRVCLERQSDPAECFFTEINAFDADEARRLANELHGDDGRYHAVSVDRKHLA